MNKLLGGAAIALATAISSPAHAEFTLDILHINDFHSRFESITASDSNCDAAGEEKGECFGGIGRLKTEIDARRDAIRADGGNVVLLSAGDNFQGSLFYTTYKSKVVTDFFNQMGFDVVATGNHEFDDGPEEYRTFVLAANFPIVGGNFDISKIPDLADKVKGTHILEVGGERIGIIGATTEDTPEIAASGPDVPFSPVIDWVKSAVADLESQQVNKIILLSHVGYGIDQEIARQVSGVDLIVGGHTHTLLSNTDPSAAGPYPTWIDNPDGIRVPIVQAHQYGRILGDLKVTWDDQGNLTAAEGEPVLLDKTVAVNEDFSTQLAALGAPLEEMKAKVVGEATEMIDGSRENCRARECTLGNLAADAQLDRVRDQGVTISIQNGGGVRASFDAGPITMGEVLTVFPFSNTLATMQITGAEVLQALENGVSQVEDGGGRFPQVAGLKFTFDISKPAGSRVSAVEVQEGEAWAPLDPAKTYGVVTNNFVRGGGDGYSMFATAANAYDFGPPLEQVLADYIAKQGGAVTPYLDGRITDATPQ